MWSLQALHGHGLTTTRFWNGCGGCYWVVQVEVEAGKEPVVLSSTVPRELAEVCYLLGEEESSEESEDEDSDDSDDDKKKKKKKGSDKDKKKGSDKPALKFSDDLGVSPDA